MLICWAVLGGFVLDAIFGDPAWLPHPVVLMGKAITALEKRLRAQFPKTSQGELCGGAVLAAILPVGTFLITALVCRLAAALHPLAGLAVQMFWCAQALAARGLAQESRNVYKELQKQDLPAARKAVPELTRILPESWAKTYYHWLDNIRDWCISRQIWWGHRIPAWTCAQCGELIVAEHDPSSCPKCGCTDLKQDEDVLDTWFSSALWPFSTMGWPEQTKDLATWYPTSVLVTGFDIIFFWVARMMMMGQHFMGQVPFHDVYLHALVRDETGRKMSKSTGNVIDPLEMIDKYGCDSLRFTLTAFAAMGRDIRLSEARIEGYRHFVNKLWNAARFALMNLPETAPAPVALESVEGLHHQWILHRLEQVKQDMDKALEEYRFNDAAQLGYKFLWNEFCDWYLELIKPDMQDESRKPAAQRVLWVVLRELLLLLHPIIPFVTAEIWNALPVPAGEQPTDIALELYPAARPGCLHEAEAARMELVQGIIVAVRTIKAELNISPSHKVSLMLHPVDEAQAALLESCRQMMTTLARLEDLQIGADLHAPKASASSVVGGCQVIVPLKGAVDLAGELARLDKEMA